jgi:two-component SAPR family response regulator
VDLVITDQAMPGMTGVQLAKAIRRHWPQMPMILASGYAEISSDLPPKVSRLNKPFRQDGLARIVAESMRDVVDGTVVQFRSRPAEEQPKRGA